MELFHYKPCKRGELMKTIEGFTLVELMIVVSIISLLTGIAIPAFMQYRADTRAGFCANNLRMIEHGKQVVAIKMNVMAGAAVDAAEVVKYIVGGAPVCPDAGAYTYGNDGTDPVCGSGLAGHALQ